jgi:hypothetical protein
MLSFSHTYLLFFIEISLLLNHTVKKIWRKVKKVLTDSLSYALVVLDVKAGGKESILRWNST